MYWWQILACVFSCLWLVAFLRWGLLAWRLAKLVWWHRVPENVVFPVGVTSEWGITPATRPVHIYLVLVRVAFLLLVFLVFAATGCPGKIGLGLDADALGRWGVPIVSVISIGIIPFIRGLASVIGPQLLQYESAQRIIKGNLES